MPRIALGYFNRVVIGDRKYWTMIHDEEGLDGLEMTISDIMGENNRIIDNPNGIHIMIADCGLDGRCNFGISAITRSSEGIKLFYNRPLSESKGLENQPYYQKLYEDALDGCIN